MIVGYGIDIMGVERIRNAINRHPKRFLDKIYSPAELITVNDMDGSRREEVLTTYWAVKEATMKALGTGHRQGVRFIDIEVCHEKSGKPYINLYGKSKEIADKLGVKNIHVSMSHLEGIVAAAVIFED